MYEPDVTPGLTVIREGRLGALGLHGEREGVGWDGI